jgi:hypothetical protein
MQAWLPLESMSSDSMVSLKGRRRGVRRIAADLPFSLLAEPDNPNADGSNLSPTAAAKLWKQYFEPLRAQGKKLVAPAVTSGVGSGLGLDWLDQFVAACTGCTFDAYAFHPYSNNAASVQGSIDSFVAYKNKTYNPVWITEFGRDAYNYNASGGLAFMKSMLPYLEAKKEVQKYAYIASTYNSHRDLQTTTGALTAMGKLYIKT